VAAIPIVALFYIDQNISALLTQVPSVRLAKGGYFHFSFLLTGLFNLVFPMFGLPFVSAARPFGPFPNRLRVGKQAGGWMGRLMFA